MSTSSGDGAEIFLPAWLLAASAADTWLAENQPGTVVYRELSGIFEDDEVFVFQRVPGHFDDQVLVVEKATMAVRLVISPIGGPEPYPNLEPIEAPDEGCLR